MHVCFLLYMLAILPVRTAFGINPSPGSNEFIVDVVIDILIFIDIILNFRCVQSPRCRATLVRLLGAISLTCGLDAQQVP